MRISPDEVSISSLRDFKEIHRVGSPFLKSPWYKKFVMGRPPGMFDMPGGREHAERRKLFARAFSKSELRRVWEGVVREKVRMAVGQMKNELDATNSEKRCDVLKWWTFLATDVSGHLMFGEDFGMLQLGVVCPILYYKSLVDTNRFVEERVYPRPGINDDGLWHQFRATPCRVHRTTSPHPLDQIDVQGV